MSRPFGSRNSKPIRPGNNKKGTPQPPEVLQKANKIRAANQKARTAEKAKLFYVLYKEMGPDRSIELLQKVCSANGLKCSVTRLKDYSAKYNWQQKLLESSLTQTRTLEQKTAQIITEMNDRHARIAQAGMAIAIAGIKNLQDKIIQGGGKINIAPGEIAYLYKLFQAGERIARGQATSRQEVQVEVTNVLIHQIGMVFLEINKLPDANLRESEFGRRVDEILVKYHKEPPPKELPEGE